MKLQDLFESEELSLEELSDILNSEGIDTTYDSSSHTVDIPSLNVFVAVGDMDTDYSVMNNDGTELYQGSPKNVLNFIIKKSKSNQMVLWLSYNDMSDTYSLAGEDDETLAKVQASAKEEIKSTIEKYDDDFFFTADFSKVKIAKDYLESLLADLKQL